MQSKQSDTQTKTHSFLSTSLGLMKEEEATVTEHGCSISGEVNPEHLTAIRPDVQNAYRNGIERRQAILAMAKSCGMELLGPYHTIHGKAWQNSFNDLINFQHITELNEGSELGPILLLENVFFEYERKDWYYPRSKVAVGVRYFLREKKFYPLAFDLASIRTRESEERIYSLVFIP